MKKVVICFFALSLIISGCKTRKIEKERILYKERRNITEQMEQAIQDFNSFCLDDNSLYKLNKDYNDNITWSVNEWEVRQNIENKLAIALLSSDWQERLPEIIESIASQFTGK